MRCLKVYLQPRGGELERVRGLLERGHNHEIGVARNWPGVLQQAAALLHGRRDHGLVGVLDPTTGVREGTWVELHRLQHKGLIVQHVIRNVSQGFNVGLDSGAKDGSIPLHRLRDKLEGESVLPHSGQHDGFIEFQFVGREVEGAAGLLHCRYNDGSIPRQRLVGELEGIPGASHRRQDDGVRCPQLLRGILERVPVFLHSCRDDSFIVLQLLREAFEGVPIVSNEPQRLLYRGRNRPRARSSVRESEQGNFRCDLEHHRRKWRRGMGVPDGEVEDRGGGKRY